ncbi:SGNH/GDSL hydrolase family protein [Lacisediminihabitans sp. H27-G8]|uniref:SGNH/GDSL hydrolase family protein n=1 Tax=Lacisediminihabitans sp. H27-G8 TaxID=3111909 RepID=UPI0038FC27C9
MKEATVVAGSPHDAITRSRMRFQRTEALLCGLPGAELDLSVQAAVLGVTAAELSSFIAQSSDAIERAAAQLTSGDPDDIDVAREGLRGRRVVLFGDSITADHESWAEILKIALAPEVEIVTSGRSGDTTGDLLARFASSVREVHPNLVVVLAGTNDARQYRPGRGADTLGPCAVSVLESEKNFAELDRLIFAVTGEHGIFIAPPPIVESWLSADPSAELAGVGWCQENVTARADVVERIFPSRVARLERAFSSGHKRESMMLPDGLHPNLRGQMAIARVALTALAHIVRSEAAPR